MSGSEVLTQDDDIDVAGAFRALGKRWWLVTMITLAAGVGLFSFLSSLDAKYQSDARILIKDGNNAFTRATSDNNPQNNLSQLDQEAVRSEVEIAGSDKLALQVIDELELTKNLEFNEDADGGGLFDMLLAILEPPTDVAGDARNVVLDEFRDRLKVYAVEQSRVIVVEFWAHDPVIAQQVVESLSTNYIKFKKSVRENSQESATNWLDPKIKELEIVVSRKEAAVADYRANEDLLRSNDNDSLLATQQLSQISTELSRLKAQRSSAQAKVAAVQTALQNGTSLEVIPDVVDSNLVQRLREREVGLQAEISDLSVTLLPNHPRMKSLNSQLANLRQQIRTAAQNIVKSLRGDVASIQAAEADLAKEIVRLKAEAARVDEKLVELRAREREAETARDLLAEYKSRSLEAKSRAGLAQTDAEIISPASLASEPYFPKVGPFTIAGTIAALLLTCLSIIAANLLTVVNSAPGKAHAARREEPEMMNTHPGESAMETEKTKDIQNGELFPEMPASQQQPQGLQNNEEAIAVRYVATALADMKSARLAVISPAGDIGSKTTLLLARHMAEKNRSTIVIELSEDGAIARDMLGSEGYPGFFNLISGAVTAERAIFKDRHSNAHVVPAGVLFPGQLMPEAEVISDMVDAIAKSYEFCILDCGAAEIDEVNVVSDDDTVAIVSCIGVDANGCKELEKALKEDGFGEVLQVLPDHQDEPRQHLSAA